MKVNASISPLELIGAVLYWPPFSFVIAIILGAAVVAVLSRRRRSRLRRSGFTSTPAPARYAPEHRTIGIAAIVVALAYVVEFFFHGYVLTGPEVWWWRFALPIACAAIGIGVALCLIATRGTTPPEVPVPGTRRTWLSFSSRSSLLVAAIVVLVLLGTTVTAGVASSPNDEGQYVWLAIPIPNEADIDPLRFHFYGWTYGLPVLVSLVRNIHLQCDPNRCC